MSLAFPPSLPKNDTLLTSYFFDSSSNLIMFFDLPEVENEIIISPFFTLDLNSLINISSYE